jgi:hypothetical protein
MPSVEKHRNTFSQQAKPGGSHLLCFRFAAQMQLGNERIAMMNCALPPALPPCTQSLLRFVCETAQRQAAPALAGRAFPSFYAVLLAEFLGQVKAVDEALLRWVAGWRPHAPLRSGTQYASDSMLLIKVWLR